MNELYYVKPGPGYSNSRSIYITFCDFVPIVSASNIILAGRPLQSLMIKGTACLADDLVEVGGDALVHTATRRLVTLTYNETNWGNNSADGGFFSGHTGCVHTHQPSHVRSGGAVRCARGTPRSKQNNDKLRSFVPRYGLRSCGRREMAA